jgi:hypothetical protein
MNSEPARPITAAAAQAWALELLRSTADALESAPRRKRADALRLLVPSLTEVERTARLLGLR